MAQIVAFVTNDNAPLTSPTDEPTIRVRRIDTGVLVETDQDMTELGDGLWSFSLTTTDGLEYAYRIDADPAASSQVTANERYLFGTVSGTTDARLETDVPAVLVDTGTTLPASIATIDSNVDSVLVDTGTTLPATLSTISGNVDSVLVDTGTTLPGTLSTISGNVDSVLVDTGTTLPATLATIDGIVDSILVDTGTTLPASISSIPTNVWGFDIRADTGVTFDTAGKSLNSCRIISYNRLKPTVTGVPTSMSVFEDDGTTVKASFALLDYDGAVVTGVDNAAADRAAGT